MYASENIRWLVPYVELAKPHLPRGVKITRIGSLTVGGRYGQNEQASIFTNDEKNYRIYIHTHTHPRGQPKRAFSSIEMLELLAHELAHTEHLHAHTPEHKVLEAKLIKLFMNELKRNGYVSEEEEEAEDLS